MRYSNATPTTAQRPTPAARPARSCEIPHRRAPVEFQPEPGSGQQKRQARRNSSTVWAETAPVPPSQAAHMMKVATPRPAGTPRAARPSASPAAPHQIVTTMPAKPVMPPRIPLRNPTPAIAQRPRRRPAAFSGAPVHKARTAPGPPRCRLAHAPDWSSRGPRRRAGHRARRPPRMPTACANRARCAASRPQRPARSRPNPTIRLAVSTGVMTWSQIPAATMPKAKPASPATRAAAKVAIRKSARLKNASSMARPTCERAALGWRSI